MAERAFVVMFEIHSVDYFLVENLVGATLYRMLEMQ